MRNLLTRFSCLVVVCLLLIPSLQPAAHAQDVVVSYQTFYDQLSPYGQWVSDPEYGNVWVPNEAPGYRPYATGGHWAMTEYGNMWVSDAPYGWACYHYGRWTYNPYYGWVWIPGHEWAPAWVSWRSGGGYYGWAPMGPGYYPGRTYDYPDNYWVFVGPEYLYRPNVYGYYEPRHHERYMRETVYINETYVDNGSHATYYYGPRREVIERESHQPVQVYQVSNSNAPGASYVSNNSVSVYRPAINAQTATSARPTNVIRATEPIGQPRPVSRSADAQRPAFHEEIQKQNPSFRTPNNYSNPSAQPPRNQPAPQNFQNRTPNETPVRQNENWPQPQHFQNNEAPTNRPEPQNNPQQINRVEQQQFRNEPQPNRPQPQNNDQMNRPQRNQQPQNRPQPQQRPQRSAPPQKESHDKKK